MYDCILFTVTKVLSTGMNAEVFDFQDCQNHIDFCTDIHDVGRTSLVNRLLGSRQRSLLMYYREQDKEATVYVGNLDERATDSLVWELMLQAGRIVNVHLPKDRVTQTHQGYGFVEFISEEDAEYAARIMNQVRLYGKPIRVNKASADKQKTVEVGAELFVGNLDPMVTEQTIYDTFGRFGSLVAAPKVSFVYNGLKTVLTSSTGRSR